MLVQLQVTTYSKLLHRVILRCMWLVAVCAWVHWIYSRELLSGDHNRNNVLLRVSGCRFQGAESTAARWAGMHHGVVPG